MGGRFGRRDCVSGWFEQLEPLAGLGLGCGGGGGGGGGGG